MAENRRPQVMGIASCFLALSTIAVVLRCYCRVLVVKCFGSDDWLAVIAWVSLTSPQNGCSTNKIYSSSSC